MSFGITIPFYAFKLNLSSGNFMYSPLSDETSLVIGQQINNLAKKYGNAFQKKVLHEGALDNMLDEYQNGDFYQEKLSVAFGASKDRFSYPDFELEFSFYYKFTEHSYWGIVPVLRIEAYAESLEELMDRLQCTIKLNFIQQKKLQVVQNVVTSIWYDSIELIKQELKLDVPTPREIQSLEKEKKTDLLSKVGRAIKIDRQVVYGRDDELKQMLQCLSNQFSKNVLLVGASGTGKTALVWEASRKFGKNKIKGKIWETTASTLIKELTKDTGWQDNLAFLCKELAQKTDLLFIRNLMDLFEVGKYEGNSVSMAEYLRTYLSRGEISVITECTEEELARIELQSPNYLSNFHVIRLEEPKEKLENIIVKKVKDIADVQKLKVNDDAIREVIHLNKRFTPYAGMPGKPIRFLESILINHKKEIKATNTKQQVITKSVIYDYFCSESGIPEFMVNPTIALDAPKIQKQFNESVFGQEAAVDSLVKILKAVKASLIPQGKPIASLFFVGPTGVGKTELAKVLAEFMFGHRNRLIRFDMSEYSSPYDVLRLIGTDAHSDGVLTSAISRTPFAILLFDEIEKAHSNFYDLLLQMLDEGRLTDSRGQVVNFCSTIIIMTSNIGASTLQTNRIGWNKKISVSDVNEHFQSAIRMHFRPELLNRINQIIPFSPLDADTIRFIVDREIKQLKSREGIQFRKLSLQIEPDVLDLLGYLGYNSNYGARYLQRIIREKLNIPLSIKLNEYDFTDQLVAQIGLTDEQVTIKIVEDPLGLELLLEELEIINYADHSSSLRRTIAQLQEGSLYSRLLSEYDFLNRKRIQNEKSFWKDKQEASRYEKINQLTQEMDKITRQIEDFEMNINLSALQMLPYRPELVERLNGWKEDFTAAKENIFSFLNPPTNKCHFIVYGNSPFFVTELYLKIFDLKEFEYTLKAIRAVGGHNDKLDYEEVSWEENEIKFQKIIPLDEIVAFEFEVKGNCVSLFLAEEKGFQKHIHTEEKIDFFYVTLSEEPQPLLKGANKKAFYQKQNPRRVFHGNHIKDTLYNFNRPLNLNKFPEFIIEKLDERFIAKLNLEFV
ncbi:MAG: AAA family ATPase [Bacteroidota bacterium]